MPSPVTPNDLKTLLNDTGGSFCDKFLRLLKGFPEAIYNLLLYERNEDGTISDAMKDDICALGCAGGDGTGGPSTGSLSAPTNVSATDGTLGDRVRITWNTVSGATSYQIFRRDTSDSSGATIIGTSTLATFDDITAVVDTVYYYWIKAVNATLNQISGFSAPDTGFRATALDAVTTLDASQGLNDTIVSLVWTPVAGATSYDIYRNTSGVFDADDIIDSDRVPFNNERTSLTGPTPTFVDAGGDLVYFDTPPTHLAKFYYWVVAKRGAPTPAVSAESNSALGWSWGIGDTSTQVSTTWSIPSNGPTSTVPVGATRAWIVLFGNGGSGAGGGAAVGGGGGGGGAMAWGILPVAAGGVFRITNSAAAAGNAAATTNGGTGAQSDLEYQPPAGAFAMVLRSSPATGGLFNGAGGGLGGTGSGASADAAVVDAQLRPGRNGEAGSGNKGGRGGNHCFAFRMPAAHVVGESGSQNMSWTGDDDMSGGGSWAVAIAPGLATGGNNAVGGVQAKARIVYYS